MPLLYRPCFPQLAWVWGCPCSQLPLDVDTCHPLVRIRAKLWRASERESAQAPSPAEAIIIIVIGHGDALQAPAPIQLRAMSHVMRGWAGPP